MQSTRSPDPSRAPPRDPPPGRVASSLPDPPGDERRPRTGLVLSAGSYHCAAHIGVIRALEREGISVDLVTGTSGGALVGMLYCAGLSSIDMLGALQKLRLEHLFTSRIGSDGFADMQPVSQGLAALIGQGRDIASFSRQFSCVAAHALTGDPVVIMRGNAASAVQASMAIPGLVRPVIHEGQPLVDGAVVQPIPVSVARRLGADIVIAVDVNLPRYGAQVARHPAESLSHCFDMAIQRLSAMELGEADVVIRPAVSGYKQNLAHVMQLVIAGERAATEAMPLIRSLLAPANSLENH